jgi:NADPH2:quinone reductase
LTIPFRAAIRIVVEVCAAGVNPFDVMAGSGRFYAKPGPLPCVVGLDGVGRLADGRRVYFAATVAPYGAAAPLAPVSRLATVLL